MGVDGRLEQALKQLYLHELTASILKKRNGKKDKIGRGGGSGGGRGRGKKSAFSLSQPKEKPRADQSR